MSLDEKTKASSFKVRDRRFWHENEAQGEVTTANQEPSSAEIDLKPAYVHTLEAQLRERDEQISKLGVALRTLREESKLARERLAREQQQNVVHLKVQVLAPLLEVFDNLELCLKSLEKEASGGANQASRDGIRLIIQQFLKTLQNVGVSKLSLLGKPFNPDYCEAIATSEESNPDLHNVVLEEYSSAYLVDDRLLRPGRVRVGRTAKSAHVEDKNATDAPDHP